MIETKRFSKNDNGFVCQNCGFTVLPLGKTSRNHCPRCLCSLHVDIHPGDRACDCRGLLIPITVRPDPKKGYIITSRCQKCGELRNNRAALKNGAQDTLPDEQYDDEDLLIRLTAVQY